MNAERSCGALHQNPEFLLSHSAKVSYSNVLAPVNSLLSGLGSFPAPTEWDSISLLQPKHFTELWLLAPFASKDLKTKQNKNHFTSIGGLSFTRRQREKGRTWSHSADVKRETPLVNQTDGNSEARRCLDVVIPRLVIQSQDTLPFLLKCHAAACFCYRTHLNQV